MPLAEKTFENKVKKFLKSKGAWYVKYFANAYTPSGIPDILVCLNGYFIAIEVKAENGRVSELQKYNLNKIARSGGIGIILYPSGFDNFKNYIEKVILCNTHIPGLAVLRYASLNGTVLTFKNR